MKNKGWYAFWLSLVIGFLIWFGLYLFTEKLLASIVLGFGLYGVVYYLCVGMGVLTQRIVEIKVQLSAFQDAVEELKHGDRKECTCGDEKKSDV